VPGTPARPCPPGQAALKLPGRPGPILRAGLVGVTLIGVGMAGFGAKALVDDERFLAKAAVADGVVVSVKEVVERRQTGSGINAQDVEETPLYPVVRFTTAAGRSCSSRPPPTATHPTTGSAGRSDFSTTRRIPSR
jgi:hypothetical protein